MLVARGLRPNLRELPGSSLNEAEILIMVVILPRIVRVKTRVSITIFVIIKISAEFE